MEAEDIVFETRELLCNLFSFSDPEYVIFTKNITESLNVLIKGLFKPHDHVLISGMEHNAVLRPLNHLKEKYHHSLNIGIIPCNPCGELPLGNALEQILRKELNPNTKALMVTHASNVCGTILPLKELGTFAEIMDFSLLLIQHKRQALFPSTSTRSEQMLWLLPAIKDCSGRRALAGSS